MSSNGRLQDKVVVVTGGGDGLGREFALAAAREGGRVAVLDYDGEAAEATAAAIDADAVAIRTDVNDRDDVDAAITSVVARLGRPDVLLNVAGIYDRGVSIEEFTPELWDRIVGVNARGAALMMQRTLREMLPARSGVILNMASTSSFTAAASGVAYAASKGALVSLTRQVAWEVSDRGIRVNALAPGPTSTNAHANAGRLLGGESPTGPATEALMARMIERAPAALPLGRFAEPHEMVGAAMFLVSDEASYVTGSVLVADGGWTMV